MYSILYIVSAISKTWYFLNYEFLYCYKWEIVKFDVCNKARVQAQCSRVLSLTVINIMFPR